MLDIKPQDDDELHREAAETLPAEASDEFEKEGYCPLGDMGCTGLAALEDGSLWCGLEGYPNCSQQAAACKGRRQEAR